MWLARCHARTGRAGTDARHAPDDRDFDYGCGYEVSRAVDSAGRIYTGSHRHSRTADGNADHSPAGDDQLHLRPFAGIARRHGAGDDPRSRWDKLLDHGQLRERAQQRARPDIQDNRRQRARDMVVDSGYEHDARNLADRCALRRAECPSDIRRRLGSQRKRHQATA